MASSSHDLAVAFGVTVGAGLATSLGSMIVFVPNLYSSKTLAICLALAAGVMIYVSFAEILVKSTSEFAIYFDDKHGLNRTLITAEDYEPPNEAFHAATGMFFAGVVLTWALDWFIHYIYARAGRARDIDRLPNIEQIDCEEDDGANMRKNQHDDASSLASSSRDKDEAHYRSNTASTQRLLTTFDVDGSVTTQPHHNISILSENRHEDNVEQDLQDLQSELRHHQVHHDDDDNDASRAENDENESDDASPSPSSRVMSLLTTSLITGTAIALHNFPEGLATFVATAKDPSVGAPLGIAIAIHNIPEGICVAIPFYFASKKKWKAFLIGSLSGLAEPIAGAIGWIILSESDTDLASLTYAILFGLVSGMMIYISFRELLPTARAYDKSDKYVTVSLFIGMAIMATSLMLFRAS